MSMYVLLFLHKLSILFQNKHKEAKNCQIQKGTQYDNDDNEDKAREKFCDDDAQREKIRENQNIQAKERIGLVTRSAGDFVA